MPSLYLDRRDLVVQTKSGCVEVRTGQVLEQSIPFSLLDRIVIVGSVTIESKVLLESAERKIPVLFLSKRNWEGFGSLSGRTSLDCERRIKQALCYLDHSWRREFGRQVLRAKFLGQLRLLRRLQEERPEARMEARKAEDQVRAALSQVEDSASACLRSVRGWEGAAARAYFAALQKVFPPSFGFDGRNRRPPRDPVNAMLSLGYTLLHHESVEALRLSGLDASIGFLHGASHGRQSLACDVVEAMRSRVDAKVWELVRSRTIRIEHFHHEGEKCIFGKAGRRLFYEGFEEVQIAGRRRLRSLGVLIAQAIEKKQIPREEWDEEDVVS